MCGIVSYIGKKPGLNIVVDGLESLEYRGYDSAGVSLVLNGGVDTHKQVGAVSALRKKLDNENTTKPINIIGHTRWATHGTVSLPNAHPHTNADDTIAVVHNGIIENYQDLRKILEDNGYVFISETDTEVIPHLIDLYLKRDIPVDEAFIAAISDLRGAYAICAQIASEPSKLFAAKLASPLAIAHSNNTNVITSDPVAIRSSERRATFLEDHDIAIVSASKHSIHNIKGERKAIARQETHIDYDPDKIELWPYPHYMLKEIFEAPQTIKSASRGRIKQKTGAVQLGGLVDVQEQLRYIDRIIIVSCGTSYYAGLIGEYLIEEIAGIPVEVQLASEFKYRQEPFSRSTALLAISQSGETADTIAALKKVEDYGILRLGIVNAIGSTIARVTDAGVYCHAGPEQSVASTKAFIAQVTVLSEIALFISKTQSSKHQEVIDELTKLPEKVEGVLEQADQIKKIAKKYTDSKHMLYIGRGYSYPCALEGALKLKEITYIHAEGYAGGELKHGPLALIDETMPTIALAPNNRLFEKTLSNIEEIKARKGKVITITTTGNKRAEKLSDDTLYIPKTTEQFEPLLLAIILQLFAYYVAVEKGLNVDRPRNLAKSVTVE